MGVDRYEQRKKKSVKEFVQRWTDKEYEKDESQKFWLDLLNNVLGVPNATRACFKIINVTK